MPELQGSGEDFRAAVTEVPRLHGTLLSPCELVVHNPESPIRNWGRISELWSPISELCPCQYLLKHTNLLDRENSE